MSFELEMTENDELEKIGKEMIVNCLKIIVLHFLEGLLKTTEMRTIGPRTEI
jgi:hypothetical protein